MAARSSTQLVRMRTIVDDRTARALRREVSRLTGKGGRPVGAARTMFKQWHKRYATFTQRRFIRLSRSSGGEWPQLASSTIARRRKGRGKGTPSTLVDTGTIKNAISVGDVNNMIGFVRGGVVYGFQETPHEGTALTVAELATIHDQGLGNVPQRKILVQPDRTTLRGMKSDVQRFIVRTARRHGG